MNDFPYTKIPGAYRGFLRKASLWEGPDHLLSITGTRFQEEYRRFYYSDIQAIIIEKRARAGSVGLWLLLCLAFLGTAIPALIVRSPIPAAFAIVLAALIGFRCYLSFGTSCRCLLQTAVSKELLPSILRRKAAAEFMGRLSSRISDAQSNLGGELRNG